MAAGGALIAGLIQVMMPQLAAQHQLENTFKILLTVLRPGTSATRQELRRAFNLCNVPLGQAKSLVELLLERGFLEECDNDERIRISEAGVRLFHDKYGHGLKELGWR
jgi:predicted transcriptional regulator